MKEKSQAMLRIDFSLAQIWGFGAKTGKISEIFPLKQRESGEQQLFILVMRDGDLRSRWKRGFFGISLVQLGNSSAFPAPWESPPLQALLPRCQFLPIPEERELWECGRALFWVN